MLDDLSDKAAPGLGIFQGAGIECFGAKPDDGKRCVKFVRDIGDKIATEHFEAAQVGDVVHHHHGTPDLNFTGGDEGCGMDGEIAGGRAGPFDIAGDGGGSLDGIVDGVE